jgi:hypothetical protein
MIAFTFCEQAAIEFEIVLGQLEVSPGGLVATLFHHALGQLKCHLGLHKRVVFLVDHERNAVVLGQQQLGHRNQRAWSDPS